MVGAAVFLEQSACAHLLAHVLDCHRMQGLSSWDPQTRPLRLLSAVGIGEYLSPAFIQHNLVFNSQHTSLILLIFWLVRVRFTNAYNESRCTWRPRSSLLTYTRRPMATPPAQFSYGLEILATCLLFAVCFAVAVPFRNRQDRSQTVRVPARPACQPAGSQMPENLFGSFLFLLSVPGLSPTSSSVSLARLDACRRYLCEHVWHLDRRQSGGIRCLPLNKLPQGMIRAIFVQGGDCRSSVRLSLSWRSAVARCLNSSTCVACCSAEAGFDPPAARHPRRSLRLPVHVLRLLRRLEKP